MATKRKSIKIKKSKRGTFTKAAKKSGMSVQQKAADVLADSKASPAMKKKANFARNAAKFKKGSRKKKVKN